MLQGAISTRPKLPLTRREIFFAFLAPLAICIAVQFHADAFSTDLSAHPDEPAHAVTGLMIRDYLAGGFLESANPMSFARDYYDRYPKVALGHYPPVFYLIEAVWLLPARSIVSCVSLITTLGALWLTLTHTCVRRSFPTLTPIAAFIPAALIPFVPMVGNSLVMVMSDLLLALLCLGATLAFARFIEKPTFRSSLLFGILAAAAGLTKASGLLLAAVPPLACLLSGRLRLLLDKRLWVAPLPVVLTVIPWLLATRHITQEGMLEVPLTDFITASTQFYAFTLIDQFGMASIVLGILFVSRQTYAAFTNHSALSPIVASLTALAVSTIVFYAAIPAGLEPRYLLPLVPSIAILATGGIVLIASLVTHRLPKIAIATILGTAVFAGFVSLPDPVGSGFEAVSESIISTRQADTVVLVSSDAVGEGAVIATAAFSLTRDSSKAWKFLRSTKVLSTSDWMGRSYKPTVSDTEELASLLDSENVSIIIEDHSIPDRRLLPHNSLLREFIATSIPEDRRTSIPVSRTAHSDRQGAGDVVVTELEPSEQPSE